MLCKTLLHPSFPFVNECGARISASFLSSKIMPIRSIIQHAILHHHHHYQYISPEHQSRFVRRPRYDALALDSIPCTSRINTYATTTRNSALSSRARLPAVEELVAVVRLGRLVVEVVGRVAIRVQKLRHLDIIAG
jgi:hypothetical protein